MDGAEVDRIFAGVDMDESGSLHYMEFLAATIEARGYIEVCSGLPLMCSGRIEICAVAARGCHLGRSFCYGSLPVLFRVCVASMLTVVWVWMG